MAYSTLMHAYVEAQACASKKVNNSLLLEVTKTSTPGDDPGVCVCVCVFLSVCLQSSRNIYIGNLLAMEEVQMMKGAHGQTTEGALNMHC